MRAELSCLLLACYFAEIPEFKLQSYAFIKNIIQLFVYKLIYLYELKHIIEWKSSITYNTVVFS